MLNVFKIVISILCLVFLFSCSNKAKLIYKTPTDYGTVRFYTEFQSNTVSSIKRIYATIDSNNAKIYYSVSATGIVKTVSSAKNLCYNLYYGTIPSYFEHSYVQLSLLDSFVLSQSDKLIDSFKYRSLKKSEGAYGYLIEVCYYHGYPKNKKFKP